MERELMTAVHSMAKGKAPVYDRVSIEVMATYSARLLSYDI